MGWINLGRLLEILRRRGIDPHEVTVSWDGHVDGGFRRPPPRYTEPVMEPEDDEYQDYDEEEA